MFNYKTKGEKNIILFPSTKIKSLSNNIKKNLVYIINNNIINFIKISFL